MATRNGTAHVVTTTRKYKDQVYRTHLLRRSYREDGKVKNETLGNLSHLPESVIDIIRRSLQGETFVPASAAFEITSSRPHGHVHSVCLAMRALGFSSLIASKPCPERDRVLAMVALRIVAPTPSWPHKMAKHFALDITDTQFDWSRRQEQIDAEAALDGLYIIRTSVVPETMDAPSCVRNYKSLAQVKRAFCSLKTVDLKVRPIHHRTADRVRAHILLCMLAYYLEWHMREAWRCLMFADTEQELKQTRDPVAPAQRSAFAKAKAAARELDDGTPVHSSGTLMAELSTVVRNTCRSPLAGTEAPSFEVMTTPTAAQRRAFDLIESITL